MLDPILAGYGIKAIIPPSLRGQRRNIRTLRHAWRRRFFWIDHLCSYCGRHLPGKLTEDHVIPLVRGGPDTFDNIVQACHACNNAKGSKSLLMFLLERAP